MIDEVIELLLVIPMMLSTIGDYEHQRWAYPQCEAQPEDMMSANDLCRYAYAVMVENGIEPYAPIRDAGGISNLGALISTARCESRLNPRAFAQGYVQGDFNRSRGLFQIGSAWWPDVTVQQANNPWFGTRWVIGKWKLFRSGKLYPECGQWGEESPTPPDELRGGD